jgi:hypothetical protein
MYGESRVQGTGMARVWRRRWLRFWGCDRSPIASHVPLAHQGSCEELVADVVVVAAGVVFPM